MEGLAWFSKQQAYYDDMIRRLWVMFPGQDDYCMMWRQKLFSSACQLEVPYTCSGFVNDEAYEDSLIVKKEMKTLQN